MDVKVCSCQKDDHLVSLWSQYCTLLKIQSLNSLPVGSISCVLEWLEIRICIHSSNVTTTLQSSLNEV